MVIATLLFLNPAFVSDDSTVSGEQDVIMNEVSADQVSTGSAEFGELYDGGVGNTALDGLVLVLYNGSDDAPYLAFDLDGQTTDGDGYFVLCGNAANTANCEMDVSPDTSLIQNGADAVALLVGDAADFPIDTPVTTTNLIDAIVYDTDDGDDAGLLVLLNAGQPQVNERGGGDDTGHSNQRCPNGGGGARNTDAYIQDTPTPGNQNQCPASGSLEISKEAPSFVYSGELLTYTITVNNMAGLDLADVVITDVVPVSTTFASASDGGVLVNSSVVSWTVSGGIDYRSSITRTFMVTATTSSGISLVNDDYGMSASNWLTPTAGSPVTTTVLSLACDTDATLIHSIQGSGTSSPIDGSDVVIQGVVTGDYQDTSTGLKGFFVQEETADHDADPLTSEGIFVYDNGFGVDVDMGDVVRVQGVVDEYNNLTEITSVSKLSVCSTGASVTPTGVTLPISDTLDLESVEGMLVNFSQRLYVTDDYNLGRYGEVSLSVNDRLFIPTNVITPGTPANALQALNDRSRILLDDGNGSQNPDPIIYPSPELSATNIIRSGDSISNLTGVLDYAHGNYRIQPTGAITFTSDNPRPAAHDPVGGVLKVASFNVLNYFNGDGQGGGFPTSRGASSQSEFTRQRDKIINAILAMDADVIGLMEIENDGYSQYSAIQDLVNGLNAVAGAGTYDFIDPGVSMIGTDAIAVGFLYKPGSVEPLGSSAILDSTVDPDFIDTKNRPVLAQTFEVKSTGDKFTVAVNHLKSKGSDCDTLGDPDTGDGQGNCNLTRTKAANALGRWLATGPTSSGITDTLIIGDLNSYAKEDPITAIVDAGYVNLVDKYVGSGAYSYIYYGQAGYLDHALASSSLVQHVIGATIWHINADEPNVLNYKEEYKSTGQVSSLYADDPYRSSDHDPVIVGLYYANLYLPVIHK